MSRISPLAGPSQIRRRSLPGGSLFSLRTIHILRKFDPRLVKKGKPPCGSLIPLGILDILKKALWLQETHTFEGCSQCSLGQSVNSQVVHFCRFGTILFFPQECGHSGVPFTSPWRHSSIPLGKVHILIWRTLEITLSLKTIDCPQQINRLSLNTCKKHKISSISTHFALKTNDLFFKKLTDFHWSQ